MLTRALLLALLIGVSPHVALPDTDPSEAERSPVELDAEWLDAEHASLVREAADRAWRHTLDILGQPLDPAPERSPILVLTPDVATYERLEQERTGGAFRTNLAFMHHDSLSAFVAL